MTEAFHRTRQTQVCLVSKQAVLCWLERYFGGWKQGGVLGHCPEEKGSCGLNNGHYVWSNRHTEVCARGEAFACVPAKFMCGPGILTLREYSNL